MILFWTETFFTEGRQLTYYTGLIRRIRIGFGLFLSCVDADFTSNAMCIISLSRLLPIPPPTGKMVGGKLYLKPVSTQVIYVTKMLLEQRSNTSLSLPIIQI